MIYMGDEYGHTKGGNNNTYCHDNYVILLSTGKFQCTCHHIVNSINLSSTFLQHNYFQWDKKEESSSDFFRFCRLMTKFRQ